MRKQSDTRGFTLIEVIVVIVLLGIIAGMIVPRMSGSLQRRQAVQATSEFAQTARTVADLAVARQQSFAIEIDAKGYNVTMQSKDTGQYQPVRVSWLRPRRWPNNVRLLGLQTPDGANAGGGLHRLEFRPDGSTSGALLRVGNEEDSSSISVNAGNARTRMGDTTKSVSRQDQYDLGD